MSEPAAAGSDVVCARSSLEAGEGLAGTATQAARWLLVETRGAWARDVAETELPAGTRELADAFDGRVLMIRRPDRRDGEPALFVAETHEHGGTLRAVTPAGPTAGPAAGGRLVLVCCHGRRDPCCARLGTPVFEELRDRLPADALWQSSHLGGHRFAANVLVLPEGILLGRVAPQDAAGVAGEIALGNIPLDHYRGRTIHPPEAQAADAAVRRAFGLAALTDVVVESAGDGRVRLSTPSGVVDAVVEACPGPPVVESCGKAPAATIAYSVRW